MMTLLNTKYCLGCAGLIHSSAISCPNCGAKQSAGTTGKSRMTAVLLAGLLGGVGGHKFYLGQVGLGIVYLLFFVSLIPSIIAFIEMIIYLTMSDEQFAEKYNRSN